MPPRLQSHHFSSFIAFYSCSRQNIRAQCRNYSLIRFQCQQHSKNSAASLSFRHRRQIHATAPCKAAPKDPYQVLGVQRDASQAELKKTYFALARKYHPDTNSDKGAQDKFVEIQEAYDTLKDEKKRAAYDQYGHASQQPGFDPNAYGQAGRGFPGGFPGFARGSPFGGGFRTSYSSQGGSPGDLFEELFGAFPGAGGRGGTRASANARGEDVQTTLTANFLEACKGSKKKVTITPIIDCTTCSGSGLKAGVSRSQCKTCNGTGAQTYVIDNGFHMSSTCGSCNGEGSTAPRGGECTSCGGVGKVRNKQTINVTIPAGTEDGMVLRVPNAGDAPLVGKGSKGDLLVRINVTPSTVFTRQGANLSYQARVPFYRALLGGIVRVPTLEGEVDVRIPGGTQQGEEMVLKERGVPHLQSRGKGDLYVKFYFQLPRSLTAKQRALLEEYAADVEGRPTTQSRSSKKDPKDTSKEPLSVDNDSTESSPDEKSSGHDETGSEDEAKRAQA